MKQVRQRTTEAVYAQLIRERLTADPSSAQDAARAVADLAESPGWAFLRAVLEERAEGREWSMLMEKPENHLGYVRASAQAIELRCLLHLPAVVADVARAVDEAQRQAAERAAREG